MELNKIPINLEAEAAVLGGLIRAPDEIKSIINILNISDFSLPKHQIIYEEILNIFNDGKGLDVMVLA